MVKHDSVLYSLGKNVRAAREKAALTQEKLAEIAELEYPWRIDRTELVDGSGGRGRFTGGMAMRRDLTLLADEADGMYYVEQTVAEFAPRGRAGGESGAPGAALLRRAGETHWQSLPGKGYLRLKKGDSVSFISAAGGGYGPVGVVDTD